MSDINNLVHNEWTVHLWHTDFVASLKEFFSFQDKNWKLQIPELEWKNIADIWAGFSDSMNFLRGVLWNNSKIICVDWIYNKEYIKLWISKAIDNTVNEIEYLVNEKEILLWWRIDRFITENINRIYKLVTKKNTSLYNEKAYLERQENNKWFELNFLYSWKEEEWIEYKVELEKSDNIDIAFCKNLFYKIDEPIRFIEEVLEKLNDNWELIIIDYYNLKNSNTKLLVDLVDKKIIEGITYSTRNSEYIIFKIRKENFLDNKNEFDIFLTNLLKNLKPYDF